VVVEGLTYVEDFVTPEEERELLDLIEPLDFRTIEMRGQVARRRVRHFGLGYDYDRGELAPVEPLPEGLEWLRERAAALIEREPEVELAPRSAYVLSGKARWSWQHSIPPGKELRYSVTFRTLRRG
jgi:alkylated DNA repair protein (DNA oxidative demethylase)